MMKVIVTGARGMVARAAAGYCRSIGDDVTALSRAELDIADSKAVNETLARIKPQAVINCAAYTDVDGAEANEAACYAANADGVENLAIACRQIDCGFVTISTDYVFDGSKSGFYTQRDTPSPQGVYAKSKLDGEIRAKNAYSRTIVVRSGWIYGSGGTNFLSIMHRLLAEGKAIKAISDSFGTPTYAADLARRLRELAQLDLPATFHVTNAGPGTSYLGFAEKVCEIGGYSRDLLEVVTKDALKRAAPRPASSKLACLFSERFGLKPLPFWETSLAGYLASESAVIKSETA
jgi:dTDP-4-dehydrorhamnose reductase